VSGTALAAGISYRSTNRWLAPFRSVIYRTLLTGADAEVHMLERLRNVINTVLPRASELVPDVPVELDQMIADCLAKKSATRLFCYSVSGRIKTTIFRTKIMAGRHLSQYQALGLVDHPFGDQLADHLHESRVRADGGDALDRDAELVAELLRFDVEVEQDFKVVRDKTDRQDE